MERIEKQITINGELQHTSASTLEEWVATLNIPIPATALATALNGQFVPRELRSQQPLVEGDSIVTFQAIVGG